MLSADNCTQTDVMGIVSEEDLDGMAGFSDDEDADFDPSALLAVRRTCLIQFYRLILNFTTGHQYGGNRR